MRPPWSPSVSGLLCVTEQVDGGHPARADRDDGPPHEGEDQRDGGPADAGIHRGRVEQPEHAVDGPQRGHSGEDSVHQGALAIDAADLLLEAGGHDVDSGFLFVMRCRVGGVTAASTSSANGYRSQECRPCCGDAVENLSGVHQQKLTEDSLTGYIYATRDGSCSAGGFPESRGEGR
jgi:hypothetical protein